jgi:LmbE family N-acetylglucosaminyl deacetylase
MSQPLHVLALFAHPDDAEFLCAGTLILLADRGAAVHIATLTAGDCGSAILSASKISRLRTKEAQRAAGVLGAQYTCLRQHLGQGFPQNDLLSTLLGECVRRREV